MEKKKDRGTPVEEGKRKNTEGRRRHKKEGRKEGEDRRTTKDRRFKDERKKKNADPREVWM